MRRTFLAVGLALRDDRLLHLLDARLHPERKGSGWWVVVMVREIENLTFHTVDTKPTFANVNRAKSRKQQYFFTSLL